MRMSRWLTVSAAAVAMLGSGLSRAEESRVNFDPLRLQEQARTVAAASSDDYREPAQLQVRSQRRLMWDAGAPEQPATAAANRNRAQHAEQARRRLEARLNSGQSARGSRADGDAAPYRWRENRFGQGYEARMRSAQGASAGGAGRSAGGRR